jgi:hypothetical protein
MWRTEQGGEALDELIQSCPADLRPYLFGEGIRPIPWTRGQQIQIVTLKKIGMRRPTTPIYNLAHTGIPLAWHAPIVPASLLVAHYPCPHARLAPDSYAPCRRASLAHSQSRPC